MQIVEAIGGRLIVAGPGDVWTLGTRTTRPVSEYVEQVGVADVATRKRLMAKAKAMILPSTFVEPFCGVQVEAMLSGTPIITTDWGAFAEYNIHGVTGYRCRTFEQFLWAAANIGNSARPPAASGPPVISRSSASARCTTNTSTACTMSFGAKAGTRPTPPVTSSTG
jgi:hypothetical protein